jgi:pyruvate dehydrogenase E1 component alpha subunit
VARWKERDPIFTFEERMLTVGAATRAQLDDIWDGLGAEIESAIEFAESSPPPSPDQLLIDVYTGSST